jgi:hypothetical protein
VLTAYLYDLFKADAPQPDRLEAYKKDVERLTAESWRAESGPDPDDERP